MKLLLTRHAESNGNANGGDYAVVNADALSRVGLAQADALAECLKPWDIDAIIVSPAQRALQTIAPYLTETGRNGEVWPELAEACWQYERETPAARWDTQPATLPDDFAQHFAFREGRAVRPAGPQSFAIGLRRVYDALGRIENRFGGTDQTILMVSHRFFIRAMLNLMLKLPEPEAFDHDNCGMTLMSFDTEWAMGFCNRRPDREAEPIVRMER